MKLNEIEAVIRMVGEVGLTRLDMRDGDFSLKIRGAAPPAGGRPITGSATLAPMPSDTLTATLSGAFYEAPSPGAPPFVTEGGTFSAGDVLGIIEAMKTLNEVVAPSAGRIIRRRVADGEVVDVDQPLFDIAWNT